MSDTMLYGVLRMPYEMAMEDYLARLQFYNRAQEAADRLEVAERRLAEIDAATPSPSPASDAELPPLPDGCFHTLNGQYFSADQMQVYARTALQARWCAEVDADGLREEIAELRARAASTRTASATELARAREAGMLEAAQICDAQANEPECPERASYCADAIRAACFPRTASDTRTAAGEAECDAALGRAAPASQQDASSRDSDVVFALRAALRSVNAVAIERGDKFGACDQIDNDGQPYQSQWFADLLADPRTASTDAATRSRAEGGNTCKESVTSNGAKNGTKSPETRMDTGFEGGHLVDVEAERKLFEAHYASMNDGFVPSFHAGEYDWADAQPCWRTWLAARTQADAGKNSPTTKPENT